MSTQAPQKHKASRVDRSSVLATLRIYGRYFQEDKRVTYPGVFLTLVALMLRYVLVPLLIAFALAAMVQQRYIDSMWLTAGIGVSFLATTILAHLGNRRIMLHEERVTSKLYNFCMEHLMAQSYLFFSDRKVGSLTSDVVSFSRGYLGMVDEFMFHTAYLLVGIVFGLVAVAFVAPLLLVPLLLAAVLLIATNIHNVRARSVYRNQRKVLHSALIGEISDSIGNSILVKMFARERHEIDHIREKRAKIHHLADLEIGVILRETILRSGVIYTLQTIVLATIIVLVSHDLLSLAGAIFAAQYMLRISEAMFQISGIIRSFEQVFVDAAPMTALLAIQPEITDEAAAQPLRVPRGEISFQNVHFRYDEDQPEHVFENFTLTIPAGSSLGLAGHSGGGKSTLTRLLLRFSDVSSGSITIDGQSIAKVTQQSLRSQIAYVPQDPFLFHRSLRDNIAYGKADAADDEIITAAKKAHAWEFIKDLAHGLDTIVGERGVKLSGGQRQRVAIARAILKDAPILVLDEATSALDSESEKLIQEALATLMKGRTSIVIAHRLSTIAKLDRIIVLENGSIVEDGAHVALLQKNGVYAKLWAHQSGGFLEN